ncbi:MAG: UxaA family hydrolase [Azospirillaceae bacterium]
MQPHFLVHDAADTVGVVVVEGIEPGQTLEGWVMDTDTTVALTARAAIPLGHKIALKHFADGDTVVKYGHDIGRVVAPVEAGGHVHVHNVKTKRW